MSRALHGNNFALVWMLPGAPAKMGKKRSSKEEVGAFSCMTGAFHHFLLNAPCLQEEKKDEDLKRLDVNE